MSPPMREVVATSNPLLVRLRKLARDPAAYRRAGELWLEGEHLVEAWCAAGRPISVLVAAQSHASRHLTLQALGRAADAVCLPDAVFASLSPLESPAGIGVLVPMPDGGDVLPQAATVVLDRLQDPGNVGTVLRTAAALGFAQVLALKGTAALWSPKVLRGGMGAHLALHLVEGVDDTALAALTVPLVATVPGAADALWSEVLPWPMAWVVGHEGQGVAPAVLARCARSLRIPQPGGQESLNAAVAASICLYESARQRALATP